MDEQKGTIDLWASFLNNEKLNPSRVEEPMTLVRLCEELAKIGTPYRRPYHKRVESYRLVCRTAINLGIDIPAMLHKGVPAMSRALLDAWNATYTKRFGSAYGTSGWKEDKRRRAVTNSHLEQSHEVQT